MTAGWGAFARPARGWDVFFAAALLGAVGSLLHEIADTPRRLGAILMPVGLLPARSADRGHAA